MTYVLFVISLGAFGYNIETEEFSSIDECFNAREHVIQEIGRPIINYQAICVIKTN